MEWVDIPLYRVQLCVKGALVALVNPGLGLKALCHIAFNKKALLN